MQFSEVLTKEETDSISRFVDTFDAEYALSEDYPVISLAKTIEAGGYEMQLGKKEPDVTIFGLRGEDDKKVYTWNVPKLALARHSMSHVYLSFSYWNNDFSYQSSMPGSWMIEENAFYKPAKPSWSKSPPNGGKEIYYVSELPPLPREAKQAIEDYPTSLVLWEAEWEKRTAPLGDPAILVPLIQDLYAVAYSWDLTEVEQRALAKSMAR